MKIIVTGGCGYKGHVLVPKILAKGHEVCVHDIMWFGNELEPHDRLTVKKSDVRTIEEKELYGFDIIIHLASIANDPCGDLNPKLTWETSCLATMQLAHKAEKAGIKQFLYASSGSVYGVKEEHEVTEDLSLEPISEYNKTKMVAERVLLSHSDKMSIQIVRPATVCGISPRMRFDVSVNMLTMQALTKRKITVFGGAQIRPNIHIDDICDLYLFLIENPKLHGIFNAGFENLSIMDIAKKVSGYVHCEIVTTPSNDPRSYRLNSNKILKAGFAPKKGVDKAIEEIIQAFKKGVVQDDLRHHNLAWMKKNLLAEAV